IKASLLANVVLRQIVTTDYFASVPYSNRHAEVAQACSLEPGREMLERFDCQNSLPSAFYLASREIVYISTVVLQHVDHIEVRGLSVVVYYTPRSTNAFHAAGNNALLSCLIERLFQVRAEKFILFAIGFYRPVLAPVLVSLRILFHVLEKLRLVDSRA